MMLDGDSIINKSTDKAYTMIPLWKNLVVDGVEEGGFRWRWRDAHCNSLNLECKDVTKFHDAIAHDDLNSFHIVGS